MPIERSLHARHAEEALVARLLNDPDAAAEVAQVLAAGDIWDPLMSAAYAALVGAWRGGKPLDQVSLFAALQAQGLDPNLKRIIDLPFVFHGKAIHHAHEIIRARARRDLTVAANDALASAGDEAADPFDVAAALQAALVGITAPTNDPTPDLHQLDAFMDRPDTAEADWVVDGLLRRGWRCVIVGAEGGGKSMLWRQFAVLAAQGIHPLEYRPIPKVRTLLVDLENPEDAITKSCRSLRAAIAPGEYEPGRAWIWHRPAGIDLRSRVARAEFEANLQACRPDLVCLGPLYKAYHRKGIENDEQAVAEVQSMLDDLRTRYGFALLLEHHAPQDNNGHRTMRPYGSSLWLRWPELGIGMERDEPDNPDNRAVALRRWRGDRMSNSWPKRLEQGFQFPWAAG